MFSDPTIRRPRILVFVEYFVPGFKAGGPLRSVSNLLHALGAEFDFAVFTRDRDQGDRRPFDSVTPDVWRDGTGGRVCYASPKNLSVECLLRVVKTVNPHVVYLNSAFAPMSLRILLLRRLGLVP